MSEHKPRERNGVQWARIAGVLAAHPDGLTAPQITGLCGFAGRPRERAVVRYRGFLHRMERHRLVTSRESGHGLVVIWRLAGTTVAELDRRDISFGDAGSVTVIVNVRWLDLPEEKFTKLRKALKEMEALASMNPAGNSSEEER